MSKVRINDLARELEVKSRSILDALTAVGVTEKKTHSSSIEADEAEKVRGYFNGRRPARRASKAAAEAKPKFDLSHVSKPGDALKAILERKQAEAGGEAAPPPRPAAVVAPPATAPVAPATWRRPAAMAPSAASAVARLWPRCAGCGSGSAANCAAAAAAARQIVTAPALRRLRASRRSGR